MRRTVLLCVLVPACMRSSGIRYEGLPSREEGALHIISFDVGQADAMLILYGGKSMLIDAGSPLTDPLRIVRRVPRRLDALLGGRHLDYFVVTHYHLDHIGGPGRQSNRRDPAGIYALIERSGVTIDTIVDRGFWTVSGKPTSTQEHYQRAVASWLASGVVRQRRVVQVGDVLDLGERLQIEVVSASANGFLDRAASLFPQFYADATASENDYSVALKLTLGAFEMFTGGDLTGVSAVRRFGPKQESYNDIESLIAEKVGAVELYHVNHHGSRHSTNPCFAQVLAPLVSVFSTGPNSYGHPDPTVVERLRQTGDIYVTGGADNTVRRFVENDIYRDDIEVLVAPRGDRFWVNGVEYTALSDQEERKRQKAKTCAPDGQASPESYERFDSADSD